MKKQNSILEIKGLLKQIDNEDTLHNVNLNFKSGRVYGLLGPNGAGKTTLMKCVLSLSRVNGGKIVFDGEEITNGQNFMKRGSIGSLIETPQFPSSYTVQNVIDEQLEMMNIRVGQTMLADLLSQMQLTTKLNDNAANLSLGWRQKLGITRAMCTLPKLLLLDEPFNGLYLSAVEQAKKLIVKLASRGTCVVLTSHILEELQNIADHLYLVDAQVIKEIKDSELQDGIRDYYLKKFEKESGI